AICRLLLLAVSVVVGFYFVNYVVELILTSGQNKYNSELYIGNETHAELYQAAPPPGWISGRDVLPNCGLPDPCPHEHVPVALSTHPHHSAKICVAGKLLLRRTVNGGGRGINVVVVDPLTLQPIKALRFDTYASESPALETFLVEEVVPGQLVVLLTFDEASKNLSSRARSLIAELGSGHIQNLGYRDQWYMIGQAGLSGFTPYEEVIPSSENSNLSVALCFSRHIEGTIIQPDSTLSNNVARAAFCADNRHLKYFCSEGVEYDPVGVCGTPVSRTLETSPLLSSPVLVLADTDLATLALTLETLAAQPGLVPRMVVVALNPSSVPDTAQLVKLFNFTILPILDAGTRAEFVERGLQHVAVEHASSEHVVVVEEGCVLSPDLFPYLAAAMPLLADPTAMAVSAWNPNGYSGINGRPHVVMRVSEAPGVVFLVTRLTLLRHLLHNIRSCCHGRGWEGWQSWVAGGWVVVPEVSRVLVRPAAPHLQRLSDRPLVRQLFYRLRRTSVRYVEVQGVDELRGDRYFRLLSNLLHDG
ncbi:Glycosyl transferase family 13, partial [Trinorchestia longiramus]